MRGSPEEAVGEQPYRAKANCRKASIEGESAGSDEAQYSLELWV